jgi:hypothetical protein
MTDTFPTTDLTIIVTGHVNIDDPDISAVMNSAATALGSQGTEVILVCSQRSNDKDETFRSVHDERDAALAAVARVHALAFPDFEPADADDCCSITRGQLKAALGGL